MNVRGKQVLFGEQLDYIGKWLEQTMRAHALRADAHLNMSNDFALHPLQISERSQQDEGDNPRLDEAQHEKVHDW
jgi:hypothetical protein